MEKQKDIEVKLLTPPADIFRFKHRTVINELIPQHEMVWLTERIEYPVQGGILVWFKGLLEPKKGFPFPVAINAINAAKRAAVAMFRPIAAKELKWAWLGFVLTPWKQKLAVLKKTLEQFNRNAGYQLRYTDIGSVYLDPFRMMRCTRELEIFIREFLIALGVDTTDEDGSSVAAMTALIIATIFEYDDAYHYRLMDALDTITTSYEFARPRQAVKMIFNTLVEREGSERVRETAKDLRKIAKLAILHPKISKAWRIAAQKVTIHNFHSDRSDRYHMLERTAYNHMGLNDGQKFNLWIEWHNRLGKSLPRKMQIL